MILAAFTQHSQTFALAVIGFATCIALGWKAREAFGADADNSGAEEPFAGYSHQAFVGQILIGGISADYHINAATQADAIQKLRSAHGDDVVVLSIETLL